MAELHGDALCHAPLLGEHVAVLLLIVHQLPLEPCVAPVDLVQPCHLHPHPIGEGRETGKDSNGAVAGQQAG